MYLVREFCGGYIIAGVHGYSRFFNHLPRIPNYFVDGSDYFRVRGSCVDIKLPLEFFLTEEKRYE